MKRSNYFRTPFFSVLFILLSSLLPAQNIGNPPAWNWVKGIGGLGYSTGSDVTRDAAGNAYVVGSFSGAFSLDNNQWQSFGLSEGYLAKFAPDGTLLWARQIKNSSVDGRTFGRNVVLDNAGNVVVAGSFRGGNVVIGAQSVPLTGVLDVFLAKFTKDGSLIWVAGYGNTNITQDSRKLAADDSGNLYSLSSEYIVKFNANGSIIWTITEPGTSGIFGDLVWNNNKLYLGGSFFTQIDLGNQTLTASLSGLFLCEVSVADGSFSNAIKLMESKSIYLTSLIVKSQDEIYLSGTFQDSLFIGSCVISNTKPGSVAASFLTKMNQTGCLWTNTETGTALGFNIKKIALDASGGMWVGGERNQGAITFGNDTLGGDSPGFLLKFKASDGTLLAKKESAGVNGIAIDGPNAFQTGIDGFSATFGKFNGLNGDALFDKTFEIEGGTCVVTALESDNTGAYFAANILGVVKVGGVSIHAPIKSLLLGKLSLDGTQLLWHKVIAGAMGEYRTEGSNDAYLDKTAGFFYCAGSYYRPITYHGETYPPVDLPARTFFVVQIGTNGDEGWLKVFPHIAELDNLSTDHLSNLLVCGTFNNTIDLGGISLTEKGEGDFFIAKINKFGNVLWAKRGGGEATDYAAMTSVDAQNNIYLVADCSSLHLDIDDNWSLSSNDGDGNLVLAKLSPDGTFQWAKLYGADADIDNENSCYPTCIKTDPMGNTFITGYYGRSNAFGNLELNSPYLFNNFIGKFDSDGTPLWITPIKMKRLVGNYHEMDIDELGNAYIAGQIRDSTFIDGHVLTRQGLATARNVYFARFVGQNGALDWLKQISGSPEGICVPAAMSVHDHESILCGGTVSDRIVFDNTEITAFSGTHGYLVLLGQSITVGVFTPSPGNKTLEISPNPASSSTTISTASEITSPVKISIVNSQGVTVFQQNLSDLTSKHVLDISQLPAGVYFLNAAYGNTMETKRLVIY